MIDMLEQDASTREIQIQIPPATRTGLGSMWFMPLPDRDKDSSNHSLATGPSVQQMQSSQSLHMTKSHPNEDHLSGIDPRLIEDFLSQNKSPKHEAQTLKWSKRLVVDRIEGSTVHGRLHDDDKISLSIVTMPLQELAEKSGLELHEIKAGQCFDITVEKEGPSTLKTTFTKREPGALPEETAAALKAWIEQSRGD